MTSTYSLEPKPEDSLLVHEGYGFGKLASPSVLLDNLMYLQLSAENQHDLAFDKPPNAPFLISGLMSAKARGVLLDTDSFVLQREGAPPLKPTMLVTHIRAIAREYGREPYSVCDFRGDNSEIQDGLINVPLYVANSWPPENIEESVLCLSLEFDVSTLDIPPQKQFQLHFRYLVNGQSKDVTLYFYPFKYEVFRS